MGTRAIINAQFPAVVKLTPKVIPICGYPFIGEGMPKNCRFYTGKIIKM